MRTVKHLRRKRGAEVFSADINLYNLYELNGKVSLWNLYHLYRFPWLTFPVEPISMIEVHMANFCSQPISMIEVEHLRNHEIFRRRVPSGVYNRTTTHETAGMVTRFEEGQSTRKKCGSVTACHWQSFRVSASKRLDMEEVSGSNPL